MGRRTIPFTEDSVARAIKAVKRAGIEIKTVSINVGDGSVVINGENEQFSKKQLEESTRGYL